MSQTDDRLLAAVGLSPSQERLYEALLEGNDASLGELSRAVDIPQGHARELLESLRAMGLVSQSAARPVRYLPTDPKTAIELLILRRQQELGQLRSSVDRFAERFRLRSQRHSSHEIVEVITGQSASVQWIDHAIRGAETEILGFGKAPQWEPPKDYVDLKLELLAKGVRCRGVYERDTLDSPGFMDFLERMAEAGEQSRIVDHLPMRLLIVDASLAFTPIEVDRWDEWLLLHRSPLLAALTMVFETVWEQAESLPFESGSVAPISREPHLTADDRRVLVSLASGLHDEVIARQLGVTPRTVLRRVNRLMHMVRATTRFQAGWRAHARFADTPEGSVATGRSRVVR